MTSILARLLMTGFLTTSIGARSDPTSEATAIRPSCDAPDVTVGHVPGHLDRVLELRC